MKKPIIGITSSLEREADLENYHRTTVSIDYTKSVIAGGGIPIIIPITNDRETIKEQIAMLDGLILSGGADLNPHLYGQDFMPEIHTISPQRDEGEMMILEEFFKTSKPILGICRGHQLLNVFYGGSLFQDLKYSKLDVLKHSQDFYPALEVHKVDIIDEDNILFKNFGSSILTNSFHHQSVDRLGEGLTLIAKTSDGIVEGFCDKSRKFLYGVQWHPEMMTARGNENMKKIFVDFVESCRG